MHKQLQPYAEAEIDGGDKVSAAATAAQCVCVTETEQAREKFMDHINVYMQVFDHVVIWGF